MKHFSHVLGKPPQLEERHSIKLKIFKDARQRELLTMLQEVENDVPKFARLRAQNARVS